MPLRDGFKERGLCRYDDPELWWPNGTTGEEADKIAEAKRVCSRCPVMVDCLAYAIENRQHYGIWGGTTEEERREDRREARKIMAQAVDTLHEVGVG